jgi:hypothetical protein
MMKRWVLVLSLLLAVAAASVVAAWLLLPVWAKPWLAAAGLGDVDFVIERLSLGELSVSDIRFGTAQEQRLDRITVLFRPTDLLSGWSADSVLIEGADLRLVVDDDGIARLKGVSLPPPPSDSPDFRMPAIPAKAFELRAAHLRLEVPAENFSVLPDGAPTTTETGACSDNARMAPRSAEAQADLSLKAWLERTGAARLQADLSNGRGWLAGQPEALGQAVLTLERGRSGRFSGTGKLQLDLAGSSLTLDVLADRAPTGDSPLSFALNMNASDLDMAFLSSLAGLGVGFEGQVSVQARLEGLVPVDSKPLWRQVTASGWISVEMAGGGVGNLVADSSASIEADLSLSDNSLKILPLAPWELTGHLPGPDSASFFALSDAEGQSLLLTLGSNLSEQGVAGALHFLLEQPAWPRISGNAIGHAGRLPGKALELDLDRLKIDPISWTNGGLEIGSPGLDAQLGGTMPHLEGRVSGQLNVSGTFSGDKRLSGGEISLRGRLLYDDGTFILETEDCVPIKAAGLDLGEIRSLQPIELCAVQPQGRPLFRRDPTGTSSLELTLPTRPLALAIGRGPDPPKLTGTSPEASLSAVLGPGGGLRVAKLDTRGGRLELAAQATVLSDIELSLIQQESTSVTLGRAVASSLSSPPDFPVLDLAGKASGRLDGTMKFELAARGRKVPLKLLLKGEQDFGLAIGEMSYELSKIRFSPRGTQPVDIFPAVGKLIANAQGSLGLSGGISWVAGVPVGYSRLALSGLGFDAPGLRVRGIDTRLQRASRTLPSKLASQEIRIDLLDIGLPLRKGLIRFNARKAPAIRIEKIRFAWGGGTLKTKPFRLRLDRLSTEHSVVLELQGIRLDGLLRLTRIDALEGTGTLSGQLPLRIRGPQVGIDHGSISADGPGVLRYRPEHKPAFFQRSSQTEMLFNALQDFRYDSLSIGLNGRTRDDLQLKISLAGSNPDLYDGHPFKLNFNLSGELDTIVQRSLSVATFAERLGELISRYRR